MTDKQNVYDEVTERIVAALEAGVVPWLKPWSTKDASRYGAGAGIPYNATTQRPYSGVNVLLLWLCGPPGMPAYMTYRQAEAIGAQVRGGSKGYRVVYMDTHTKRNPDTGEDESYRFMKRHTVFHASQIDDLPEKFLQERPRLEYGELEDLAFRAWVTNTDAEIRPGGSTASYSPVLDRIRMPPLQAFRTTADYQATLLHELTHWTGHKSRLGRETMNGHFASHSYAREELVAEMGAAFLCARHGIDGKLQHAEYIGHWIKGLKDDNRAIFKAAAAAQKSSDYLWNLQALPVPAKRALTIYRPQLPAVCEFRLAA